MSLKKRYYQLILESLNHGRWLFFTFLFALGALNFSAQAEDELSLKQLLLMPGKLTEPHADLETKCESCHVHFEKSNQSPLCLDCHEEVANDLKFDKGFHSMCFK